MEKTELLFSDIVVIDHYFWIVDNNINALYRTDIKALKPEFVLSFQNETNIRKNLYQNMLKCDKKIIFCPSSAREIAIYDTVTGNMEKISVDYGRYGWKIAAMYGGYVLGKRVYLFRRGYSQIYYLDILSGELDLLDIAEKEASLCVEDYFWHWKVQPYKKEDEIVLYDKFHRILYRSNLNTLKTIKLVSFKDGQELIDFVSDSSYIWILCSDGTISKLDGDRIVDEYRCDISEVGNYCLYCCNNMMYLIDMETGRSISIMKEKDAEKNYISIPENTVGVFSLCIDNNKISIQWKDGFFYYYDGTYEMSGILENDMSKIPIMAFFPDDIIHENKSYELDRFLRVLKFQPCNLPNVNMAQVGKKIYSSIVFER